MGCASGSAKGKAAPTGAAAPGVPAGAPGALPEGSSKHAKAVARGDAHAKPDAQTPGKPEKPEDKERRELREQQKKARQMVREFTTEMVKGRKLDVVMKTGKRTRCACSLTRALDALKVKAGGEERRIELVDVETLHVGDEPLENIETPLDELCATLVLASTEAITFRFPDVNDRDTFVMCIMMFIQRHQQDEEDEEPEEGLPETRL